MEPVPGTHPPAGFCQAGGVHSEEMGRAIRLARSTLQWLLGTAREHDGGLAWPIAPSDDEPDPTLYGGTAGVVMALLEAHRHLDDDRYGDGAVRGARWLASAVGDWPDSSLYFGTVGAAAGRTDLSELALAGAADVVARDEAGPAGFLVPHSDAQQRPDLIERYNYGWCHGPTGDAQVFRLLGALTGDRVWDELADRCWYTVIRCGLPGRLRPGFWDNSGRCCGTAGVLALAGDRQVERGEGLDFAETLVADIAERATVDSAGARWSNYEHRVTPGDLEPRVGWAMGSAGIVRELLRHARVASGGDPSYAVNWPDHPPAVPSSRTSRASR